MQEADGEHGVNKPTGGGVFPLGWRSRRWPGGHRWGSNEARALGSAHIAGWRRGRRGAQGAAGEEQWGFHLLSHLDSYKPRHWCLLGLLILLLSPYFPLLFVFLQFAGIVGSKCTWVSYFFCVKVSSMLVYGFLDALFMTDSVLVLSFLPLHGVVLLSPSR